MRPVRVCRRSWRCTKLIGVRLMTRSDQTRPVIPKRGSSKWKRVPARGVDSRYGRVECAYRHLRSGALLLLHRPRSRTAAWYDRIGVWLVTIECLTVARRCVYGRRVRAVPLRWAAGILASRRARSGNTDISAVECPLRREELPGTLVSGRNRRGVVFSKEDVHVERTTRPHTDAQVAAQSCEGARYILKVPLMIPSVPPWRTVRGPFAAAVLSRAEYDCFHHTW